MVARSRDRQASRELLEQVTALRETAGEADEQLTRVLVRLRLRALSYLDAETIPLFEHALAAQEQGTGTRPSRYRALAAQRGRRLPGRECRR